MVGLGSGEGERGTALSPGPPPTPMAGFPSHFQKRRGWSQNDGWHSAQNTEPEKSMQAGEHTPGWRSGDTPPRGTCKQKIPADPQMPQPTGSNEAQGSEKATAEPRRAARPPPPHESGPRRSGNGERADAHVDTDTQTPAQTHGDALGSSTTWAAFQEAGAPGRGRRRKHLLLLEKRLRLRVSQAVRRSF